MVDWIMVYWIMTAWIVAAWITAAEFMDDSLGQRIMDRRYCGNCMRCCIGNYVLKRSLDRIAKNVSYLSRHNMGYYHF